MKTRGLMVAALASVLLSSFCSAKTMEKTGDIYKTRCANCHGVKADGVPKLKEQAGMSAAAAAAAGTSSQEKNNIYGPPLNTFSQDELMRKLMDLRNKDYDSESYHSIMQMNLRHIEAREGKIADEKMAEYIYTTFGAGGK